MKRILGVVLAVLILAGGAAGILYLKKDALLASQVQRAVQSLTGVPASLQGVTSQWVGEVTPEGNAVRRGSLLLINIKEIRLANPEGFKNEVLARLEDVQAVVEFFPLLSGRWHMPKLSFRLSDVNLERTSKGEVNLSHLLPLQAAVLDKPAAETAGERPFYLGRLEIYFGARNFFEGAAGAEEPETYDFGNELQVFDGVIDPNVMVQAPAIHMIHQMGKGSLGVSLGKIQEFINQNTGKI